MEHGVGIGLGLAARLVGPEPQLGDPALGQRTARRGGQVHALRDGLVGGEGDRLVRTALQLQPRIGVGTEAEGALLATLVAQTDLVDVYDEPGFDGAKYVLTPPLREKWNQDELWTGLRTGETAIDTSGRTNSATSSPTPTPAHSTV